MGDALTDEQANVLEKIASVSKMDCWFTVTDDNHIWDAEEERMMDTKDGVRDLVDGMTDYDFGCLVDDEKLVLVKLLGSLI